MRKHYFGRQFKRDSNERKSLFRNLLNSLVLHDRIRTTEAKAKAIKGDADKLVTKVKTKNDTAYQVLTRIVNHEAAQKLINDIAPRFATRNGGYTRITRADKRINDNAQMVILEWTEGSAKLQPKADRPLDEKVKKAAVKKVAKAVKPVEKKVVEKKPVVKKAVKKPVKKASK